MRVAGAIAVLLAARIGSLAGHALPWSWWMPIAYLWQDAAVAGAFWIVDFALRRTRRAAWTAYAVFVVYVAATLPATRVMSTPMTWTMWRAAGGAIGDSIWMYATPGNVGWIAAVLSAAAVTPLVVRRSPRSAGPGASRALGFAMLALVAALGPLAVTRIDTHGLDRNAWSALAITAVPRVTAASVPTRARSRGDWREPRQVVSARTDLSFLRGAAAGRNVILVSLESTAAQYLGLYGASICNGVGSRFPGECVKTTPDPVTNGDVAPNLTALARSALVFDHAYAVYPESIKGLFSMLCSEYPVFDRAADAYDRAPCDSIAADLSRRGYRTGLFHSGRFGYLGMQSAIANRGFDVLADAGDIGGQHESSFGVDDRATVDRLLAWIDAAPRGRPFFAAYLPIAGHHPYDSPQPGPFPSRDDFDRYRNALHYGDAALGALVSGIAARGLERATFWIALGDHGEAFGQHDGNFGHTFQLYEENIHVPFVVSAPGAIAARTRVARVVSVLDTAPTILDLLGLPPSPRHEGTSALDPRPRMALFFADYSLGLLGLRDGRLKYIYEIESGRSRLFDLQSDPRELRDISAADASAARWYRDRVRAWIASAR